MEQNPLSHLTDQEMEELMRRYYRGGKQGGETELKKDFKLPHNARHVYRYFPTEPEGSNCRHCGGQLLRKFQAKGKEGKLIQCKHCNHKENVQCYCEKCKREEEKRSREQRKKDVIQRQLEQEERDNKRQEYLESIGGNVDFDSLSVKEQIYLGALFQAGFIDGFRTTPEPRNFIFPLAPTIEFTVQIINDLYEKSIILPYEKSDLSTKFPLGHRMGIDIMGIGWTVNVVQQYGKFEKLMERLAYPKFSGYYDEELLKLWRNIAVEDCFEFLRIKINSLFGLHYPYDKKVIDIFYNLILHYSVSQIFQIININIGYALMDYHEKKYNLNVVANSIIEKIQNYSEKAIENNWDQKEYLWVKDKPRSLINLYLYDKVLGLDDICFKNKPSQEFMDFRWIYNTRFN